MSSSDAASPGGADRPGSGMSTSSDETQPYVFQVADLGEDSPPNADAAPTGTGDRLGQTDRPQHSWPDNDGRETARVDSTPTNAYAAPPAYGSLGAPPGTVTGVYHGSPPGAAGPLAPPPVNTSSRPGMARRARLKIAHLGPVSVLRISLTFSLCMFIVLLVAVAALWAVLDTSGVFKSIEDAATTLTSDKNGLADWLSFGRVMLISVVLGAANVIAFTLLSTIAALLYNLCSDFVGGVEVTLVER